MLLKGARKVCNEIVKTDLVSGFGAKGFSHAPVRMIKTEPESTSGVLKVYIWRFSEVKT